MAIFGVLKVIENSTKVEKMLFRQVVAQCFDIFSINSICIEKIKKIDFFDFCIYLRFGQNGHIWGTRSSRKFDKNWENVIQRGCGTVL